MKHVGICFGHYPDAPNGLDEYTRLLGQGLAQQAPRLQQDGIALHFHVSPRNLGVFGPSVNYLPVRPWQRLWHPQGLDFEVWHTLYQHVRFKPPARARHRLLTVHDLNFYYMKSSVKAGRHARRLQRLLDRTEQVIAISDYVGQDLTQRLHPRGPVQVIHNGARDLRTEPQEALAGITPPFFLHLSSMAPNKNVPALLDLAAHWPQSRWLLAGGLGEQRVRELQEELRQRGLSNVWLRPNLTLAQKAWAYAHCEAFVFPSLTEGFGLPPIEAMFFGRAVFLSRCTCLPEIGGNAAYYFDNFTPQAMQQVMLRGLPREPADRARKAEAVQAHAQQFSVAAFVDRHVALYRRLCGRTISDR